MTASGDSDDSPRVPIVCSECGTRNEVPLSAIPEAVERHNDLRHDGEEIAEIDPALTEHIADLVAEDLGLYEEQEYETSR